MVFTVFVLLLFLGGNWTLPGREAAAQDAAAQDAATQEAAAQAAAAETAAAAPGVDDVALRFESDIRPLLEQHCWSCHGAEKRQSGLDLRRRFLMLEGGDNGPALVPGQPDESLLVQRIEAGDMPPPEAGQLAEADRAKIRAWVAAGAPLENAEEEAIEPDGISSRVSSEDRDFWAFQPPQRPAVPAVKTADRVRTPIDAFLLAELESRQLSFQPDAEPAVLVRRLYYDLLGLPPTPDELQDALSDTRPDAYERLVDRLLADPRFGERWGRHWLDTAGYADSDGYLAADRLRPQAWRYRDYVIEAHNRDLPYDQFIIEQLAGDELSDWRSAAELTPEMKRQLIATGFLRTASDPTYPGYTEPNEIHQVLSDTLQIVGTTFLGLTVHCARCHAHKFDPIPQYDYYALQAVLRPALDPQRWQPSEVRGIFMATDAERAEVSKQNEQIEKRLGELQTRRAELLTRTRHKLIAAALQRNSVEPTREIIEQLMAALLLEDGKRSEDQKKLVAQYGMNLDLAEAKLKEIDRELVDQVQRIDTAVAAEAALKRELTLIRGLTDHEGPPAETHVLQRGDYNRPGGVAEPGIIEVLAPAGWKLDVQPRQHTTGRRLALARWLTDPRHPLTARVQVNRMWAHHFGRGLVTTLANFGHSGARPSHPQLLDWLATEFIQQGWSMKAMHRTMLLSTAYRQSSAWDPQQNAVDPDNILLGAWQPRRSEGEVIRDSILSVSGKLNPAWLGPPAPVTVQPDGSVVTSDDAQGNRRSVYLIVRRSQHLTLLELFDTPVMEVNCPERHVSTVPLQSLSLMHSEFAERAAAALADRLMACSSHDAARVDWAYRLLLSRVPTAGEQAALQQFLEQVQQEQLGARYAIAAEAERQEAHRAAWVQAALVLLNSNEFVYVQ